jgi:isopenicillin N synthase-like dioxygenase
MTVNDLPLDSAPRLSSLPVIHLAPYLTDNDGHGRLSTSAALHAACREFGFFYLDLTGFATPEETEELGRLAREFFALPSEEKNKIHLGLQDNARGTYQLDALNVYREPNSVNDVIHSLAQDIRGSRRMSQTEKLTIMKESIFTSLCRTRIRRNLCGVRTSGRAFPGSGRNTRSGLRR